MPGRPDAAPQDERYHPPPAVLPRDGVVVVALGPFKALVHTQACLLFEAGKMDVSHIAPVLADLVRANNEVGAKEKDDREKSQPYTKLGTKQGGTWHHTCITVVVYA